MKNIISAFNETGKIIFPGTLVEVEWKSKNINDGDWYVTKVFDGDDDDDDIVGIIVPVDEDASKRPD